jgi:hypothetical protein
LDWFVVTCLAGTIVVQIMMIVGQVRHQRLMKRIYETGRTSEELRDDKESSED